MRGSRDDRVVRGVAALAPPTTSMLDIGASDGRIAARVARELGAEHVQGVDVERQPDPTIEVSTYNGRELPFADETFDLVTIVDVLHHADDPEASSASAPRAPAHGRVVIKDHLRTSRWSSWVLLAMDNSSNFSVHELANGRYLSTIEWVNLIAASGGHIEEMIAPFPVHELPWRLVAGVSTRSCSGSAEKPHRTDPLALRVLEREGRPVVAPPLRACTHLQEVPVR